ncbi:DUF1990 family protein [Amnibacterium endophyticum]|uniref:DUF1990 family protein n=1 Tax=Amnibacterium endophyticum TaxID=2109337 RepID=A0ABW4LGZ1_9MICO
MSAQGPARRSTAAQAVPGLNYTALGASVSPDVVAYPPAGFAAAEQRHRLGSGAHRFETAVRSLMTWGALRAAGFGVEDVRADDASRTDAPRFLDDGTPWVTPGMTATITSADAAAWAGPVKVVTVVEEPGRTGFAFGSMPGHAACMEQYLQVEHADDDAVWTVLRTVWASSGGRFSPAARLTATRLKRLDERIVRALHPSNAA